MAMKANDSAEVTTPSITQPQTSWWRGKVKAFAKALAPKLLNLVALSAILTIAGFFVVHSYMATFTSLYTFNISVTQYLAAGINWLLALLWYTILPVLLGALALVAAMSVIILLWLRALSSVAALQRLTRWLKQHVAPRVDRLRPILKVGWRVYQIIAWLLILAVVIALSLVYGVGYYSQSPRMVGGGMPATVILIFKEAQQNPIGIDIINPSNPLQSLPLELRIELTDGIMVREPQSGTVMIVKSDVLQAIVGVGTPLITIGSPTSATAPTTSITATVTP